jgi:hypothetical protein
MSYFLLEESGAIKLSRNFRCLSLVIKKLVLCDYYKSNKIAFWDRYFEKISKAYNLAFTDFMCSVKVVELRTFVFNVLLSNSCFAAVFG